MSRCFNPRSARIGDAARESKTDSES